MFGVWLLLYKGGLPMKYYRYVVKFRGGEITVYALGWAQAEILARAEAIKKCWDYEIISYKCYST
jgi:hypothetical protein